MSDRPVTAVRSIPRGQPWGGCRLCRHFHPDFTCAAFPRGIPIAIASGEVDHLVPRPGQVGEVVFELVAEPTPAQVLLLRGAARRGVPGAAEALARLEGDGAPSTPAAVVASGRPDAAE